MSVTNFVVAPGQPVNPATTKPVYLVIAEDLELTTKSKLVYYVAKSITNSGFLVEIRGMKLSKEQKNKAITDPRTEVGTPVDTQIPIFRIVRIDNITYKK